MDQQDPGIEKKSGYLQFSYPVVEAIEVDKSYELGLQIAANMRLKKALEEAAAELPRAQLDLLSAEISKAIVSTSPAFDAMCTRIDSLTSDLSAVAKNAGSLSTPAAQVAFKDLLLSKITPRF